MNIRVALSGRQQQLHQPKIESEPGCVVEDVRLILPEALEAVYHGQEDVAQHC